MEAGCGSAAQSRCVRPRVAASAVTIPPRTGRIPGRRETHSPLAPQVRLPNHPGSVVLPACGQRRLDRSARVRRSHGTRPRSGPGRSAGREDLPQDTGRLLPDMVSFLDSLGEVEALDRAVVPLQRGWGKCRYWWSGRARPSCACWPTAAAMPPAHCPKAHSPTAASNVRGTTASSDCPTVGTCPAPPPRHNPRSGPGSGTTERWRSAFPTPADGRAPAHGPGRARSPGRQNPRHRPTGEPRTPECAMTTRQRRFAGRTALVTGSSRGLGLLDVLVNNAGIIQVGPLDALREEDFRQAMETMYFAPCASPSPRCPDCGPARPEQRLPSRRSAGGSPLRACCPTSPPSSPPRASPRGSGPNSRAQASASPPSCRGSCVPGRTRPPGSTAAPGRSTDGSPPPPRAGPLDGRRTGRPRNRPDRGAGPTRTGPHPCGEARCPPAGGRARHDGAVARPRRPDTARRRRPAAPRRPSPQRTERDRRV